MNYKRIAVPIQDGHHNFADIKSIAEQFNCRLITKQGLYHTFESDDPENFFWLGMNLNSKLAAIANDRGSFD